MYAMFYGCYELEYLNLFKFNTFNVFDMESMFDKCKKLKNIEGIINFNTFNVMNMSIMFQECYELENLDLTNFETACY